MNKRAQGDALWHDFAGSGPPLVLLHGWALNSRVFNSLAARLSDQFRVMRIDLPGHGLSGESTQLRERGWTPDALAAQIAPLVPSGALVLGWSLGGQIAIELAARAESNLAALALMASTPRFVSAPEAQWSSGLKPGVLSQFAKFLQSDPHATIRDFLDLQVRGSRDASGVRSSLQAALAAQGIATSGALERGLEMLRGTDLRPRLSAVRARTLVISGQYDRVTPPAASRALAEGIPGAELRELPRAGHAPFLSHEDEVVAAVSELRSAA